MKSKFIISAALIFAAQGLKANPVASLAPDSNLPLIVVAVIVSFLALLISIINAFRISRQKKLSDIDFVNHKEDVNLSLESVKTIMIRDLNKVKRDVNKKVRSQQGAKTNKPAGKQEEVDKITENDSENDKKTPPRRKYRRKLPYKKKLEKAEKEASESQSVDTSDTKEKE